MPVSLRVQRNHRMRARVSLMVALSGLGKKPSLNGAAVAAVIIPRVSPTDAEPSGHWARPRKIYCLTLEVTESYLF